MPFFVPLQPPASLPELGQGLERATWDLKGAPDKSLFHTARDVASFANHLGGTLLIGAYEKNGSVGKYSPMTPKEGVKARDWYSRAVVERCRPKPTFDFEPFEHDSGVVLAVNVWPSHAMIGVIVKVHKEEEGYGGDSFVFPVRVGADTDPHIEPERLAMYMLPEVRRNFILTSRIPIGAQVKVQIQNLGGSHREIVVLFTGVDYDANLVMFSGNDFPLDQVQTVYRTAGYWHITFKAFM